MWDFDISIALRAMARTAPFLVLRIAVYAAVILAYMILTSVGALLGATFGLLGGAAGGGAFWGGMIGFAIVSALLYWAREYMLYLVKAGHIAVLVELHDGGELPPAAAARSNTHRRSFASGSSRPRCCSASIDW